MSTRHIARTLTLQTLFELDIKGDLSISASKIDPIIEYSREESGEGIKDISFAKELVGEVLSRRITIDDIIVRAAPDWPLDKIGVVDRNILRIGLSELLFGDRSQVPPKVAIDEAIELAKTFGGETSGKFVNGVLGAVYKEMGEPDKEQKTKTTKDGINSKKEELVGAVVLSSHDKSLQVGLVHDAFGFWTLPKGHVREDDPKRDGKEDVVSREIKKEIGLEVNVYNKLGENQYIANKPNQGKIIKHVEYYLAVSPYVPITLEKKGGLDDAKWFAIKDIKTLRIYDDIRVLIENAIIKSNELKIFT